MIALNLLQVVELIRTNNVNTEISDPNSQTWYVFTPVVLIHVIALDIILLNFYSHI